MADKELLTEERLKTAIKWVAIGILIVILATAGWWYYLNRPKESVPKILQKAYDDAKKKVDKNPNDMGARVELAQMYLKMGEYDSALAELNFVVKQKKADAYVHVLLGIVYEQKKETNKAITEYKKAIDMDRKEPMKGVNPALSEGLYRLSDIYLSQKKYDEAIKYLTEAVVLNQIDSDSLYKLGVAYYRKGDYDNAITNLVNAVRYVPNFYEAQYALGQAYEKKGDKEKAKRAYEAALKENPQYEQAKTALDKLNQ